LVICPKFDVPPITSLKVMLPAESKIDRLPSKSSHARVWVE
jgi:hypothetical protein